MDKKEMAEGLLKAIEAERYGQTFYRMAAKSTSDPKGREVFETLANEEKEHEQFLTAQYRAILETGAPDTSVSLGVMTDLGGDSPIFSEEIRKNIGNADEEMTALSVAIQLENSAVEFYKELAVKAGEGPLRTFYKRSSDWELGHYYALLKQEEMLKSEYWAEAGFEPF